jgi:hypothetical protein
MDRAGGVFVMPELGNVPSEHGTTTARAGSPLTCFGAGFAETRLYYIGADTGIHELTKPASTWHDNTIPFQSAAVNSPLTCYGFDNNDPRVYYVNQNAKITELSFKGTDQGTVTSLPGQLADDSPLTCLGLFAEDSRVYFVGTDRQLHELARDENGEFQDRALPDTKVAAGSGLTCLQTAGQQLVNVFYISATDHRLHVLAYDNVDDPTKTTDQPIDGTAPAPGSALTCFGFDQGGKDNVRVYYLDRQSRINEVARTAGVTKNHVLPYSAMPGSALTCFGTGGGAAQTATRLYYLDSQARVNELGWVNGAWAPKVLPGTADPDSALTCYGFDYAATRLYYIDAQHHVNELAWQTSKFVNTLL